jgi:hypothetical protein
MASAFAAPRVADAPQATAAIDACDLKAPGRIVAVGDVHGAFDRFTAILREAGLIDGQRRWAGGNATLVQVGDILDRGGDSRQVLDLLRQLEREAPRAGGQVRLILGNHEVMRMAGDWRYVSPGEYQAFQSASADDLRERLYRQALKDAEAKAKAQGERLDAAEFRKAFLEKTPLGAVEMQLAFGESGEYGRWLRQHDIMLRINGTIFVHAGPGRAFAGRGCTGLNADARADMKTLNLADPDLKTKLLWSPEGPLWYRGFVGVEPVATGDDVTAVLAALGGSRMVIGHTTTASGRIRSLYDGRILQIDTGILGGQTYPNGRASALEIQNGTFTAIYEGARDVLIRGGADAGRR